MSGLRMSDLNKETTYLLPYISYLYMPNTKNKESK